MLPWRVVSIETFRNARLSPGQQHRSTRFLVVELRLRLSTSMLAVGMMRRLWQQVEKMRARAACHL